MSFGETLRALAGEGRLVWGFVMALVIVLALTPLTGRLAHRLGAIDDARDRPRIHDAPIPRIGGLAIAAAIAAGMLVFVRPTGPLVGILIGLPLVAAVGLLDDLRGLRPWIKLTAIALIALVPVAGYGVTIGQISIPGVGAVDFGPAAYPLTVLWIALVANLVNLIDGMDSLAAGIVAIASAAFAVLAISFGRVDVAVTAAVVCGATLGFLRHNYHPAKVFMGDTGALTLGFVLGSLAAEGVLKNAATIALAAPLLVLAVPILDTSFVVLKRLKYRRPPFGADHNHFYHRFLRIGFSQRRTAAYLHAWAALLAAYAMLLRFVPPRPGGAWDVSHAAICAGAGLCVVAASVWMVYTLEILKVRHLEALRLRRRGVPVPLASEDGEAAVERALSASR
jgi:UDP-GlcNAc:undecaprenyl-phosphate/decaprenyl-phosphate GlcNAc-1-phosphate transferase